MNLRKGLIYSKTVLGIFHGNRAYGPPLEVNIALSNRCNVRCIHCYFHSPEIETSNLFKLRMEMHKEFFNDEQKSWKGMDADPDKVRSVIEKLADLGTQRFLFSGNGEPLIHPQFLMFAGLVKGRGARGLLNTNGLLLTPDTSEALIDMRFDILRVTTMAGSPEMYAVTHPGTPEKTFAELKRNLMFLAEKKASMGISKPKINLVCVVIAQNSGGLLDFVRFAAETKADGVLFRPFSDIGDSGLSRLAPDSDQLEDVRRQVIEARSFLDSRGMSHNIDFYPQIFREKLDTSSLYRYIPCVYPWLAARIEINGLVFPCCRSYSPLGNCFDKDIKDIWFGEKYQKIRGEAKHIHKLKKDVSGCDCGNCPHYTANLKVFRMLHPLKACSEGFKNMPFPLQKKGDMEWGGE
ncbi:MAG: radical SAM protein [Candidatus Aminicenantes bacterium]|nr:radical SAM protein [Candidatus Aminicenantes bacterium]